MEPVQNSFFHGNNHNRKQDISMVSADVGLVSMVRQGVLALQLLPPNSSAGQCLCLWLIASIVTGCSATAAFIGVCLFLVSLGIIIITDGVTSVPDVAVCETLLNQLRSGTIACSFVQVHNILTLLLCWCSSFNDSVTWFLWCLQVGGAYSYDCSFGYIPNVELMKFLSLATFGSYLPSCPEVDLHSQDMNAYHKAFLTYSFLKTPESMNLEYFCGETYMSHWRAHSATQLIFSSKI